MPYVVEHKLLFCLRYKGSIKRGRGKLAKLFFQQKHTSVQDGVRGRKRNTHAWSRDNSSLERGGSKL